MTKETREFFELIDQIADRPDKIQELLTLARQLYAEQEAKKAVAK